MTPTVVNFPLLPPGLTLTCDVCSPGAPETVLETVTLIASGII